MALSRRLRRHSPQQVAELGDADAERALPSEQSPGDFRVAACPRPRGPALAKKLMYPQERSAEGRQGSPAEPTNTTALRGRQRAWLPSTSAVMTRPVSGSAAVIVTGRPSMADMPSASIAHIA